MGRAVLLVVLLSCAFWSSGQVDPGLEKRIVVLKARNKLPEKILSDLGHEMGLNISYNADYIKKKKVDLENDSLSLKEVIDSLFLKKNLNLRLIGNHQLVIYESAKPVIPDTCYQSIKGQLLDNFTGQGLARASVKELQTRQLTISNGDGAFVIKMPCNIKSVQLEISAMGYRSRFVHQPADQEMAPIIMEGDYIPLKEVFILSVHGGQLMEDVFKRICDNYLDRPFRSTSFFREAVLKNNKMVSLSEAVFDVYNHSYLSPPDHKDQVQLVKGRKFIDQVNLDTLAFKIKGSLRSCLELDVVKNRPYFFDPVSHKDAYEYSFSTLMEYNGRDMYVIDFMHKPQADGLPYEGKMFIDKERKSLVAIEFELHKKYLRNVEEYFVLKNSRGFRTRLHSARYEVHYTDVEGRLAMNYVRFTNSFRVRKKNSLFSAKYETITEYVVNTFQLQDVNKIRPRDTFAAERIFMEQPIEYNENYWKGINFLPLEKPLIESSDELHKIFVGG